MIFVQLISLETGLGFISRLPVPCLDTSVSLCHVHMAAVKKQQQLCEAWLRLFYTHSDWL